MQVETLGLSDTGAQTLFPLSAAQTGVWFGQKLDPGSAFYNVGGYVEICGPVDHGAFERALRQAVAGADGLHLHFIETEDGPRQYFARDVEWDMPFIDVSREADPRAASVAWMLDDMARVFDLTHGPFFRFALFQAAQDRFFWYEVYHHLINDFFGSLLVERRVADLYSRLVNDAKPQTEEPSSWLDLLKEDDSYQLSARRERDQSYWRAQLIDRPDAVTLSGRPPGWPGRIFQSAGYIPRSIVNELEKLGAAHGASLSAVIAAATAIYLYKITGTRDLILGMPVTGRTSPKLRRIIGLAINEVPLRLSIDPAESTGDMVRHAGRHMREALHHQRYWAGALRKDLGLGPNEHDVYGIGLNFIPLDEDFSFAGQPVRKHPLGNWRVEDLLIAVHAGNQNTGIRVEFIANAAHYDAQALDHHRQRFSHLLEAVIAAPGQPIGRLDILAPDERQTLLKEWNHADAGRSVPPATLPELFEAQVARTPTATALVFEKTSLTYAELNQRANRLAHHLIRQGVGPETVVGIALERSPELIIALLGVLKAGGAYLPLDPAYPAARLDFMLEDARPALLLVTARTEHQLPTGIPRLVLDDADALEKVNKYSDVNPGNADHRCHLTVDHPAYVIYTSGSTGTPKGVVVTHSGIGALAASQAERLGVTARSRVLQLASLNFDISLEEVMMALTNGAAMVLIPPDALSGPPLRAILVERRISHASMVPTVLSTIENGDDLILECLIVGGEVCPETLVTKWSRGCRMINSYGPTETTVCATMSLPLSGKSAPIGSPIQGTRIYVLDAGLEPVPVGVAGEIYIAGAGLARGYLKRPGLTAERFVADPYGAPGTRMYRSGDLARWRTDGVLEYAGRTDQQIKLRGFRIELGEIEAALHAQVEIDQAAVIARDDGPGGNYLAAYLVLRAGAVLDQAQLRHRLGERLPGHMIPMAFVVLDSLPVTPSGKLDRGALPAPGGLLAGREHRLLALPQTPSEEALCEIWRDVMRVERIDRFDDFFERGGNSLMAIQVMSRVRDVFQLELPLKTLFEAHTLEALARQIDISFRERRHAPHMPLIEAASGNGPAPLSYSQERMWLIQSLDPKNTAYNMPVAIRLRGPLSIKALSDALNELFRRHEILRSTVRLENGQPVQDVEPFANQELTIVDLCGRGNEAWTEALRLAEREARTPFDLAHGPVIRVKLFQTDEDNHLFTMTLHHIAGDQWSIGVLARELAALYNDLRKGISARLEPLPINYQDYAFWQRRWLLGTEFERQMSYWRHQLANLPPLELPTDRKRPRLQSLNGAYCQAPIPASLVLALEQLGRREGGTLFMTMFCAFATLLYRITGQEDIPIGVPVANRTQSAIEGLVGTFVNTLVLRADLSGNPEFRDLLHRVRATALDAFAHQDVSFDKLVQELGQLRDTSRAPLTQVLFNVTNAPMHGMEFDGLDWEAVLLDRGGAQFELSMSVDTQVTRSLGIEYNTGLFDRATIERLIGQYITILEGVAAGPGTRLSALPLMPTEQLSVLRDWNATSASYPRDMIFTRIFEERAAKCPGAPAVSFKGVTIDYGELNARANAVARQLRVLGAGPGHVVGLCINRSLALVIALLGIQKSGAAYVPLDSDYPAARLSYMLSDSETRVLVTAGGDADGIEVPDGIKILDLNAKTSIVEFGSTADLDGGATPQDIAYVIYTSGSTGRPKGVAVSYGALMNFLWSMRREPGLSGNRRIGGRDHDIVRHRRAGTFPAVDGWSSNRAGFT